MNSLETLLLSLLIIVLILYFIKLYYLSCSEPFTIIPDSDKTNVYLPQNFRYLTYQDKEKTDFVIPLSIRNYYEKLFVFNIKYVFYKTPDIQKSLNVFFPKLQVGFLSEFLLYFSILFNKWEKFFLLLDCVNLLIFNYIYLPSTHKKFIEEFKQENKEALNFFNTLIDSFYDVRHNFSLLMKNDIEEIKYTEDDINNLIKKLSILTKNNIQRQYLPFIVKYEKMNKAFNTIVNSLPKNLKVSSLDLLQKNAFKNVPSNLFITSQSKIFLSSLNKDDFFKNNTSLKEKVNTFTVLALNNKMVK